jgi:alpha-mannosidase
VHEAKYALIPHAGLWDEARLSEEAARWNEPLIAQLMEGRPAPQSESRSLVSVSGGGVEIPALLVEDRSIWIRLFNAEGDSAERIVSLGFPARVDLIELDGRPVRQLPVRRLEGRYEVALSIPRFGIHTLRCELPRLA